MRTGGRRSRYARRVPEDQSSAAPRKSSKAPLARLLRYARPFHGRIWLASGEVRPGIRTPMMRAFRVVDATGSFGWLDGSVLVIYLAALVGLGAWFSRREAGTADYFLAGRRIPWWAAGISLYATQLSAITYLATPAVASLCSTSCRAGPAVLPTGMSCWPTCSTSSPRTSR